MNLCVVGAGYVGLVSATCFADMGNTVVCVEKDPQKIALLEKQSVPFYEPGLEERMVRNVESGRLSFSQNLPQAVLESDVIFSAVGTPSLPNGDVEMSYVHSVMDELFDVAKNSPFSSPKIIVNKSTVPVGTGRKLLDRIHAEGLQEAYTVVSNPEFLREGSAVYDFFHPDRVVIGAENDTAISVMSSLYSPLFRGNAPIVSVGIETAELSKYASNAFLATKISFINDMSVLCEAVGASVQDISRIMGMDGRIGKYFLHAGPGYGGSCFPKDTQAVIKTAEVLGHDLKVVQAAEEVNQRQKARVFQIVQSRCGTDVSELKFAVLGLSFKPNTDDIRYSSSLVLIDDLLSHGASVSVFDPEAMQNIESIYGDKLSYASNSYDAAEGVDGIILMTEWNSFRELDLERLRGAMKGSHFFDFRNVYSFSQLETSGFTPYCIGWGV